MNCYLFGHHFNSSTESRFIDPSRVKSPGRTCFRIDTPSCRPSHSIQLGHILSLDSVNFCSVHSTHSNRVRVCLLSCSENHLHSFWFFWLSLRYLVNFFSKKINDFRRFDKAWTPWNWCPVLNRPRRIPRLHASLLFLLATRLVYGPHHFNALPKTIYRSPFADSTFASQVIP